MDLDLQATMARWGTLLMMLVVAGCSDGTDCCVDGATGGLLEGSVVDQMARPVGEARLGTTGSRYSCTSKEIQGPGEGETVADSAGSFRMRVGSFLGSPGEFCIDVVVAAGLGQSDTIRGIQIEFFAGEIRDTARVVLRVGG